VNGLDPFRDYAEVPLTSGCEADGRVLHIWIQSGL
jgi:hypothetical protein